MTDPVGSVLTYRIGGREYPMHTHRRCHVCMSPYRFEIEEAIASGRIYLKVQEQIESYYDPDGDDHAPSVRAMRNHYSNGHMPVEQATVRQIVESRARRVGKAIEDSTEQLIDGVTLMEVVVQKSFEAIASGDAKPTVRDGLAASKMLAELGEYDGADLDQQAIIEAFMIYHESAEQIMSPEEFRRFGDVLAANPTLKALAARYEGEEQVVEGQVVES